MPQGAQEPPDSQQFHYIWTILCHRTAQNWPEFCKSTSIPQCHTLAESQSSPPMAGINSGSQSQWLWCDSLDHNHTKIRFWSEHPCQNPILTKIMCQDFDEVVWGCNVQIRKVWLYDQICAVQSLWYQAHTLQHTLQDATVNMEASSVGVINGLLTHIY